MGGGTLFEIFSSEKLNEGHETLISLMDPLFSELWSKKLITTGCPLLEEKGQNS